MVGIAYLIVNVSYAGGRPKNIGRLIYTPDLSALLACLPQLALGLPCQPACFVCISYWHSCFVEGDFWQTNMPLAIYFY